MEKELQLEVDKLLKIIPEDIFSFHDESLESALGRLLKENGSSLATAESCTGGSIAGKITSVPGSSSYFKGSVVAYSNEIKINLLGVDEIAIEKNGAVSEVVVKQMAEGARKLFNCDYSIATSGVAGPDGGSPEKQVGTTWIAVSDHEKTLAFKYNFGEDRGRNIERASLAGLNLLRKRVLRLI